MLLFINLSVLETQSVVILYSVFASRILLRRSRLRQVQDVRPKTASCFRKAQAVFAGPLAFTSAPHISLRLMSRSFVELSESTFVLKMEWPKAQHNTVVARLASTFITHSEVKIIQE